MLAHLYRWSLRVALLGTVACGPGAEGVGPEEEDGDGDGVAPSDGDCDDTDAATRPGALDLAGDGVDQDCDGRDGADADADGFFALSAGGDDCDDTDPAVHPGAEDEPYDGVDADCLGNDDYDADGDGSPRDDDCDDTNGAAYPGRLERCDGVDNDCDGVVDEDDAYEAPTWYADEDADGAGDDAITTIACDAPEGFVTEGGDCNDADDEVFPGAVEVCGDGKDQDCDGTSDGCGPVGNVAATDAVARFDGAADAQFGLEVGTAGDLDGDGAPDLLVLPDYAFPSTPSVSIFTRPVSASSADAGIRLLAQDGSVEPFAATGGFDSDGDGLDELLVADTRGDTQGMVYLVEAPLSGDIRLPEVPLFIAGGVGDLAAVSLATPADFDGDGDADFPLGVESRAVYTEVRIVSGPLSAPATTLDAFASITTDSIREPMGESMLSPGDLDGDGAADLVLGNSVEGEVYVFAGPFGGSMTRDDAEAVIDGSEGYFGARLASMDLLGDDGYPEILVGAIAHAPGGKVYAFTTPFSGALSPADAAARVEPDTSADYLGRGFAAPGDVDGDGHDDLAVGALGADDSMGAAYLFRGPLSGSVTPADAWGTFRGGAREDRLGAAVAGPGDVDGDGFADLLIGAPMTYGGDSEGFALFFRGGGGW